MRQQVHPPTTGCCTRRRIGPVVMVDGADRHAVEAADKSKIGGTMMVPTTVPDPPQVGGVKAVPETGKGRPTQNVGIVARKATGRASVGRSAPIRINPDLARPDKETGKARTTLKDRKDPEPEKPKRANLRDELQGKLDEEDHLTIG